MLWQECLPDSLYYCLRITAAHTIKWCMPANKSCKGVPPLTPVLKFDGLLGTGMMLIVIHVA